ncbi:hypothetical protein K2173_003388 [Erythroxylum novogranatense]|uniref:Late embryogenesis abundant protein n=1 Tax=Erythroxylum novogranatense TaxID=1862640 RepID=A0AAV8S8X1_9ROSI|nr:hypothetical protein K2173_003388 [Erythroxylum novogranatense]
MRIRKSGKFSVLLFMQESGVEPVQAYSCQLNQSPWDVIPVSEEECKEGRTSKENGTVEDSIDAVRRERVRSTLKGPRSGRRKLSTRKKQSQDTDDEKFFYYSGFGPKWLGKRRATDKAEGNNGACRDPENGDSSSVTMDASSSKDVSSSSMET